MASKNTISLIRPFDNVPIMVYYASLKRRPPIKTTFSAALLMVSMNRFHCAITSVYSENLPQIKCSYWGGGLIR